jgi:putative ABC transport system ATP-binding protein
MSEAALKFLSVRSLRKTYENGQVEALRDVSFDIAPGESVALMGPSGCGKSILLGIIGTLDTPTSGEILLEGNDLPGFRPKHRFRAMYLGFIFQFHYLIPSMTLVENVETPMIALGVSRKERRLRALQLLSDVGLEHRAGFLPTRVSGGERQRAAVARALVNRPRLLLADEPTGNLDTITGKAVVDIMLRQARQSSATVIIATHNPEIAAKADRIIQMRDGLLVDGQQ